MFVAFDQLPDDSRLWVYQSNRPFTVHEEESVSSALQKFCEEWEAHGHPLSASFKIEHNQFVILAVDESMSGASGCSIDGSVRALKEIQNKNTFDLLNRSVAFLADEKISLYSIAEVKTLVANGQFPETVVTFNNAVCTKSDFLKNWKTTIQNSWLAKYLPKKALVQ